MRSEFVDFNNKLPVDVELVKVANYPVHWHNCIEILYVLHGTVNVTINCERFEIEKGEVEIININEAHSIRSTDDARMLLFHIDQYFFEKYYNDIENMSFYTNTEIEGIQTSEEYDVLREYLAHIACELMQKSKDYDEQVEEILRDMLYHLINNFNYIIYDREDLKSDEVDLERYHRISKYIFNHYSENITLKDIAEEEFLSLQYLSHEIKYGTGYTFTDLLNLTRVNESIKLLLDTDKTLSDIAYDVGFSHLRYYTKCFKQLFSCTPLQYRKKNNADEKKYENQKRVEHFNLQESLEFIHYYLEDYSRYNYENRIYKVHIDMDEDVGVFSKEFKEVLNIGDTFEVLLEDSQDTLREMQEEIGFSSARLQKFFSTDMGIYPGGIFYNWKRTRDVLEYIDSIGLTPLIMIDNPELSGDDYMKVLKSFFAYFEEVDIFPVENFQFQYALDISDDIVDKCTRLIESYGASSHTERFNPHINTNYLYDTLYMLPYIIHNGIEDPKKLEPLQGFDIISRQVEVTNEVFLGYPGLVNDKGIKKPSYYGYYLLSKLQDTIVYKADGCIVTKGEKSYQILIYTNVKDEEIVNQDVKEGDIRIRNLRNSEEKKISLNITNIFSDVRVTTYDVNSKFGSSYNYWTAMGKPKRLSRDEKTILYNASYPKIGFRNFKKRKVINILLQLKGYSAVLINIIKI